MWLEAAACSSTLIPLLSRAFTAAPFSMRRRAASVAPSYDALRAGIDRQPRGHAYVRSDPPWFQRHSGGLRPILFPAEVMATPCL
jgi:hypothetical protein